MPWMMVVLALATGLSMDTKLVPKGSGGSDPLLATLQRSACPAVVSGQVLPREPFRPGSARMVPVPSREARSCPIPLAGPLLGR